MIIPPPPPYINVKYIPKKMPNVKHIETNVSDLDKAVHRLIDAWNITQATDAINSIDFFLDKIKLILKNNEHIV